MYVRQECNGSRSIHTFGPLKDRVLLDDFFYARALDVRLDPTDVLAPPESPSLQAQSSQVQAVRGPTPEKDKCSIGRHLRITGLPRIGG